MKTLGSISLHTELDVVAFRNKMYEVVALLCEEDIYASKVAASISSFCKFFLQFGETKITSYMENKSASDGVITLDFGKSPEGFNTDTNFQTLLFGVGKISDRENIIEIRYQHQYNFELFTKAKEIFNIKTIDELMFSIKSKNEELESSLFNLKRAKDLNARMESELEVAKDIQMSMLPLIFPAFPKRKEIDIYAELIPAREVGGDFYDFHFLDENHLCFVMADVSGKGVPAALMMAVTKTLLKSRASNDKSTASILTDVNNEIAKDNDTYMFITVFMAILNTNTGELTYSNAGHNPSYVISKENKLIKLGDLHGPVIGAMEGMTYGETRLFIKKNDIIFSYTDGVTESHNINAELYSDPRLEELLENGNYDSSKTLTKLVIQSVKEFEGEADQFDDITAMAIEYCQNPNKVSSITASIKIINDLKQIATAIEWFEAFALENKMSFAIIQKINIALDELLNNVITYGYDDDDVREIDIKIELRSERLIISISDDGIPFNPFTRKTADTMLSIEERIIGGLGIHLVKKLMDEYNYKRHTDKNIITLIKDNINT
jgi:sigma-B regulation protein RsbU (phosphoserine phosphatase)